MLKEFVDFVKNEKLFLKKENILLAVSGGADSVVMCHLFKVAGFRFAIAHCNFKLRGEESNNDEEFVKELAKKLNVTLYTTTFDTQIYAQKEGISIQMAARNLRYQWFEEIRNKYNYSYIALAQHKDDVIETLFINLLRGTGISGLHGILFKNNLLIRPLLFTFKEQILNYCTENRIKFRDDSSNASIKYIRNKIRHQIMPVLKEINPSYKDTIIKDIEHFKFVEKVYNDHLKDVGNMVFKKNNGKILLSINEIEKLNDKTNYVYEFLKPFNFGYSTVEDILNSLNKSSGIVFYSSTHRLLKDRKYLVVEATTPVDNIHLLISENAKKIETSKCSIKFKVSKFKEITAELKNHSTAILDFDKLKFPLLLRKWEKGDWFVPFGMNNKKKLSDFFIYQKITLFEKENILVLCSGNDIVWIVGHRINNFYKIVPETKKMYIAQVL